MAFNFELDHALKLDTTLGTEYDRHLKPWPLSRPFQPRKNGLVFNCNPERAIIKCLPINLFIAYITFLPVENPNFIYKLNESTEHYT